jgi:DNA-binding CsgD family transcriptional regulator
MQRAVVAAGKAAYDRSEMLEPTTYPDPEPGAILSPRELEVLELTSQGLTNQRVAAQLGVTIHAVKFHLAAIYRKLGVSNRTEAVVRLLDSEHRHRPVL